MTSYRSNFVPDGSFFFTVNPLDPRPRLLTAHVGALRGERGIWQRRYWEHTLRDESDVARHTDYIHFNPVKHGHVARVADWPYSSFDRMVKLGVYPADWTGDAQSGEDEFGER